MKLHKYTWWFLFALSIALGWLTFKEDYPGQFRFGHTLGTALATLGFPWIILGPVVLIAKLFKITPSKATQRTIYFPIFILIILGSLGRMTQRNDYVSFEQSVEQCVQAIKDTADYDIEAKMDVAKYCNCALGNLNPKLALDSTQLMEAKDVNSVLFNELIMTCVIEAMYEQNQSGSVTGLSDVDTIPVISSYMGIKVKVRIGNSENYFLLDSGASDSFISSDLESKLREQGLIAEQLEDQLYEMVDGQQITCKRVIVNELQIGEFMVDGVTVAIYDGDVGFILGKSLLDNFTSWSLSNADDQLILVK